MYTDTTLKSHTTLATTLLPYILTASNLLAGQTDKAQRLAQLIKQYAEPELRVVPSQSFALLQELDDMVSMHGWALESTELVNMNSFGINGYISANCINLYEAMVTTVDLYGTISHDKVLHIQEDENTLRMEWHFDLNNRTANIEQLMAEHLMATYVVFGEKIVTGKRGVGRASFKHQAPTSNELCTRYEEIFGSDILFSQPVYGLEVSKVLAKATLISAANESLRDEFLTLALRHLQQNEVTSAFLANVKFEIKKNLSQGSARKPVLCNHFAMSERTFQRRLMEEGYSFQGLLDSVRFEQAKHALKNTSQSFEDIAGALGFSETRSLHRGFKKWSGMTLSEFRDLRS